MLPLSLYRLAGNLLSPGAARGRLTILMYHRVYARPDPLEPTVADARLFDRHLRALAGAFNVLPLDEAVERLYADRLPARAVAITFDDGYRDNHEVALPILLAHRAPATFFIASGLLGGGRMFHDTIVETVRALPSGPVDLGWLGLGAFEVRDLPARRTLIATLTRALKHLPFEQREAACNRLATLSPAPLPDDLMMSPEQVRELHRAGMSIGGHTRTHPILTRIDAATAWKELCDNRDDLAAITGEVPRLFAYPNGKPEQDYDAGHVELVARAGYEAAVSTAFGTATRAAPRLELPRMAPWELDTDRYLLRTLQCAVKGTRPQTAVAAAG